MEENRHIEHAELQRFQLPKITPKQNTDFRIKQIGNLFGMKDNPTWGRIYDPEGLAPTLSTMQGGYRVPMIPEGTKLRMLTPKECFRLQGWTDDYFEKARLVNSDSQLYKQAGNGVTVNVIEAIAERMHTDD